MEHLELLEFLGSELARVEGHHYLSSGAPLHLDLLLLLLLLLLWRCRLRILPLSLHRGRSGHHLGINHGVLGSHGHWNLERRGIEAGIRVKRYLSRVESLRSGVALHLGVASGDGSEHDGRPAGHPHRGGEYLDILLLHGRTLSLNTSRKSLIPPSWAAEIITP